MMIKAEITIKGITRKVEFPAIVEFSDDLTIATAIGTIDIDRTLFNIRYKSKSFFPAAAKARPPPPKVTFENEQIAIEYGAALKRQRIRRLNAMSWAKKIYIFVKAGFEHIIPQGLDHILFVLGLFFSSLKFRSLIIQVTAFTLAQARFVRNLSFARYLRRLLVRFL